MRRCRVGRARQPRRLVRRERGQGADDAVLDDQRADDRRTDLAAGAVADQVAAVEAALREARPPDRPLRREELFHEVRAGDPVRLDDLITESNRLNEQVQRVLPADPLNVVAWVVFSIIAR